MIRKVIWFRWTKENEYYIWNKNDNDNNKDDNNNNNKENNNKR